MCLQIIYIYLMYMYKDNLALDNQQYAVKPNRTKSCIFDMYV